MDDDRFPETDGTTWRDRTPQVSYVDDRGIIFLVGFDEGFAVTDRDGLRHLSDRSAGTVTTFPADKTDREIRSYLRGLAAGRAEVLALMSPADRMALTRR